MSEGKRPYSKNNSFSKKPGLAQIASYTVFLLETVLFYSVVLPRLRTLTQISFGICYSASLVMLVISAAITSLADPADLMMVCYRNSTSMEYFLGDAGLNRFEVVTRISCSTAIIARATWRTSPGIAKPVIDAWRISIITVCGSITAWGETTIDPSS